ncbi:MAG: DUF4238 domain-containing protein [Enhydrobacter sp.]|nr:MAG: DUF4238 domain-containing protein [Enhydrobacter sp.]
MSEPLKHHHLPIFYLSAWTDADGELCEFKRPYRAVVVKRTTPAATGYRMELYSMPGLRPEHAQWIEKKVMGAIDHEAAKVHQHLLAVAKGAPSQTFDGRQRLYWARFLYALIFRTPEHVAELQSRYQAFVPKEIERYRARYDSLRGPNDPATFDEFRTRFLSNPRNMSGLNVVPHLANSERVIGHIARMQFRMITMRQFAGRGFLTSDRPIIMTNGLTLPHAHIVLPISPDALFIADKNDAAYGYLSSLSPAELARQVNEKVAEQSHHFVYASDKSQFDFVAKRLGRKEKATPLG